MNFRLPDNHYDDPTARGADDYIVSEPEVESALKSLMESLASGIVDELMDAVEDGDLWSGLENVRTFSEAGVMTMNPGVVLTFMDGVEFQLQVLRSR